MDHRVWCDDGGTYDSTLIREAVGFQSDHGMKLQEHNFGLAGLDGIEVSLRPYHDLKAGY